MPMASPDPANDVRTASAHEEFHFHSLAEVQARLDELGLSLPFSDDMSVLLAPGEIGGLCTPNRLCVHPMEGCDATSNGAPAELTVRRYCRFAAGGSGLLWLEATAVVPEARANPRQLWLHEETVGEFARMREMLLAAAAESLGAEHRPVTILQLTHSGRYSKPRGLPEPITTHHSAPLDPRHDLPADYPLIRDEELDRLQDRFVAAARLAKQAGYDGVDIKATHRYLINELLASYTREDSKYGGSFENRTRFLLEVVGRIKSEVPGLLVGSRLNVYDALPYPYGFGMASDGSMEPDLAEPIELIRRLHEAGLDIINLGYGNPYYNPHVERPFDTPVAGGYIPSEHPLANIATMVEIAQEIHEAAPAMPLVATGLSWLRQFFPAVAAAMLAQGWCQFAGVGRLALACPDFARDLMEHGELIPTKLCIACSSCTQIMRDGGRTGCVVRDHEIYAPIYQAGRFRDPDYVREIAATCRNCAAPTCQEGCPAGVDVPGFVTAIADGDDRRGYEILREANVLPEICAYVCPAEVQCEGACVQQYIGDGPVPIQALQRYVCERARREGWTGLRIPEQSSGSRVAVIGAGPAGLGCAIRLLELGHQVTIIDTGHEPGGAPRDVIPADRLGLEPLRAELTSILDDVPADRLQWRLGTALSESYTVDDVLAEGFAAVFLGVGLGQSAELSGAQRPESGVVSAVEFLKRMKTDPDAQVPGRVAVLGGGNTAVDAAVEAVRAGARDVYLVYRRSFAEMPAWPRERDAALAAGVHFLILTQPLDYLADDAGDLSGMMVASTVLGEPDGSGRRRPQVVAGTERVLEVDLVVEALGERAGDDLAVWAPGLSFNDDGTVQVDPQSRQSARREVFAGGDIIHGAATVVEAVADGMQAATGIDSFLRVGLAEPR